MSQKPLSEATFCEQMNLPRELVAEVRMRALQKPRHFDHDASGAVLLTEAGVDALLAALGSREPLTLAEAQALRLEGRAGTEPEVLIVVRQVPNVRQVLCRRWNDPEDAPPTITLRVPIYREPGGKAGNYFTPRLRVLARPDKGAWWDYAGTRPTMRGHLERLQPPLPQPLATSEAL
jgi:hypothetical protein